MRSSSNDVSQSKSKDAGQVKEMPKEFTPSFDKGPDYSSFDDSYLVIDPKQACIPAQGGTHTLVLRDKKSGGHVPTTFTYQSLFDIEDSTDIIENFDIAQDKIDLSQLMLSLGGDLNSDHVKLLLSHKTDLKLMLYDGPIGHGNEYPILILKSVVDSKETSIQSVLKNCIKIK